MGRNLIGPGEPFVNNRYKHGFFEDWESNYVTGDRWTPLTADSSSAATLVLVLAATGSARGVLSITQDATDNDEIYFQTTVKPILFAANKPAYVECSINMLEGATDDQNFIFGFLSVAAASMANAMIDDGGGPVASATMAVIYKIDGGTVWRCRSQIGAAVGQTDTVTNLTAGTGGLTDPNSPSGYQTLGVEVNPISSTNADVIYYLNGKQMTDTNGRIFKHNLVYTNAVSCGPVFGAKNGSGTAEVTLCDYIAYEQKR